MIQRKIKKEMVYGEDTGCVVEMESPVSDEDGKKDGPVVKLNMMMLRGFVKTWDPAVRDEDATDRMRIIDLRMFFQCYTSDDARCVDMLPYYLDELEKMGYTMRVDSMGEQYMPLVLIK